MARGLNSSSIICPDVNNSDMFSSPAKKSNAAQNQFASSDILYSNSPPPRPSSKQLSAAKVAELRGSGTVEPLSLKQLEKQQLGFGSAAKRSAVSDFLGSKGAAMVLNGYRDNDVTSNLVNTKLGNLG